jgi:hypothetical protein
MTLDSRLKVRPQKGCWSLEGELGGARDKYRLPKSVGVQPPRNVDVASFTSSRHAHNATHVRVPQNNSPRVSSGQP